MWHGGGMAVFVLGDIKISTTGYTLVAPASGMRRRRRDGGGMAATAPSDDLELLLQAADFRIAADMELTSTPDVSHEGERQRRSTSGEPAATFVVPVARGEAAVLLVEDDAGILTWHMPDRAPATARRRSSNGETLTFHITATTSGTPAGPRRRGPALGWIAEKIAEPVRVRVLRFLASRTIDALVSRIEGGNPTGPVLLRRGMPVDQWVPATLPPSPTSAEPRRVLLLVHGTFSSTAGSFGSLAGTPLFDALFNRYEIVLGYDHHTLAEDPVSNAEAMLAMLHGLDLPPECVVDAVAYSRGGLILRLLCEDLLPQSGLPITIDRAVFVGCTNSGTLLAEPDNWEDLVNIYTNVVVAAAKVAGSVVGGAAAVPWITYAIKTIGRFVQVLPQVAISERRLPGLAAMEPDGELVQRLNAAEPVGGFATRYHAITSNYEPAAKGALGERAAMFLANRALDRLLGEPNDLVVHTASMTAFGPGRQAESVHALGVSDHVFHTIYFATLSAMEPLFTWLGLTPALSAASPTPSPIGPSRRTPPSGRGGNAGLDGGAAWLPARQPRTGTGTRAGIGPDTPLAFELPQDWTLPAPDSRSPPQQQQQEQEQQQQYPYKDTKSDAGALVTSDPSDDVDHSAGSADRPDTPPDDVVDRYIAAEMEPMPQLERAANIYVTVSPDTIMVGDHEAGATTAEPTQVRPDQPILLLVIPRRNCEVIGRESCEVASDAPGEVISKFRLKGQAAGPAEVIIEARQGARTLASLLLRPVFVTKEPLREIQRGIAAGKTEPDGAVLRIYEFEGIGGTTLRFDLTAEGLDIGELDNVTLGSRFDLKGFAMEVLADVEEAWDLRDRQEKDKGVLYRSFLRGLRNRAKTRTAALIPEKIRKSLWKHRAKIKTIQIISEEPYIPWEMMYLFDPDGESEDGAGFFAERGLIRWLHNAPLRRQPVKLNGATSWYLVPAYKAAAHALPAAEAEKAMLERRIPGIQPLSPTKSNMVRDFLATGARDCTLLHFACHGATEQRSTVDSRLLMTENEHAEKGLMPDPLYCEDVKEELDFGEGRAPVVFINACQTGQGGKGIIGTAGFADAFIRPRKKRGASIFVGALWSVDDTLATQFADSFYKALVADLPLVDAVHAARKACQDQSDFTWLAYSVYCAV